MRDLSERDRATMIEIQEGFVARTQGLKQCYGDAWTDRRSMEATIEVQWTVRSDGTVAELCSVNDTYGIFPNFLRCLSSEIYAMRFPPLPEGPIDVRWPLVFKIGR